MMALTQRQLPIYIEKGEDGIYAVECPVFRGCYAQGETLDEALTNIKEVLGMCIKESENKTILSNYHPTDISLHTITI